MPGNWEFESINDGFIVIELLVIDNLTAFGLVQSNYAMIAHFSSDVFIT
jgi:hypothetical protein